MSAKIIFFLILFLSLNRYEGAAEDSWNEFGGGYQEGMYFQDTYGENVYTEEEGVANPPVPGEQISVAAALELYETADACMRSKDYQCALKYLKEYSTHVPASSEDYYDLALLCSVNGLYQDALAYLERSQAYKVQETYSGDEDQGGVSLADIAIAQAVIHEAMADIGRARETYTSVTEQHSSLDGLENVFFAKALLSKLPAQ